MVEMNGLMIWMSGLFFFLLPYFEVPSTFFMEFGFVVCFYSSEFSTVILFFVRCCITITWQSFLTVGNLFCCWRSTKNVLAATQIDTSTSLFPFMVSCLVLFTTVTHSIINCKIN